MSENPIPTKNAPAAIVRWEDPPERIHGRPPNRKPRPAHGEKWRQVAEELRARPGEWAVVYEGAHSGTATALASSIRSGQFPVWQPTGDFDAVARGSEPAVVYARYVGGDESE